MRQAITLVLLPLALAAAEGVTGYHGIWYKIGGAYSGGMATYPQHQMPMAVYAGKVERTFFVYGGEPATGKGNLQIMIGAFDHAEKQLAMPTLVRDCSTSDAHANPCMAIDAKGYIFVYAAGRHSFRGKIYRSVKPRDISAFEELVEAGIPYPQAWIGADGRHFLKYTRYKGNNREVYWTTSPDGRTWDFKQRRKLASGGHYAMTYLGGKTLWLAMNWHKGGSDKRTNLYLVRSDDMGGSWKTIAGEKVPIPMEFPDTPGLVRDYLAERKFVYLNDLVTDAKGHPVMLFVVASGGSKAQGPKGDPREWTTARWDGRKWHYSVICKVDHNYDYGNLRIDPDGTWRAVGPTDPGPHPYTTGGDVVLWTSKDTGKTWKKAKTLTARSRRNHSYVRIPFDQRPEFFAFWADGDTTQRSESDLYFCDAVGKVYRMPRKIAGAWARPEPVR